MACIAGAAGDHSSQEIRYYQPGSAVALKNKWKLRRVHTVVVDAEGYVGRLRWSKSQRNVRASLTIQVKKGQKRRRT